MVSILLPVYNVENFISKCLNSLLAQTYKDLQIVLIDDGSKDNSLSVCKEYAAKDSRIEVYHQENKGVASTRNHLLEKVNGDYVLFVDSDDWIEPDTIQFLIEEAVSNSLDMVVCEMVINDTKVNSDDITKEIWVQENVVKEFLHHKNFRGSLCNKLIKTTILKGLKFHPEISYGEDALFVWHVLQKLNKVMITSKECYHYRMNDTSISHQLFGEKKLSGHKTWTIICEETTLWWPQYLPVAQARHAAENMYLLRAASQGGYPCNKFIKELQLTIHKFLPQLKTSQLLGKKDYLYANLTCRWYGFGRLYYWLYNIKN